ncbi:hypothetical protein HD554DRAFT_1415802 [Boletus coccyginus]|nr:hypothetical protein HD554DRAFT_1415802 [Boletus coccyginus]
MGLYDTTIGTLEVGVFFNTFLYGLVTYQFAAYHRKEFNDRSAIRYMVLFLFVLDTFHSCSVTYMLWYYTVTNYDNPVALTVAEWPHTLTPLATALAALLTQVYLGFRILRLTGSKFLFGVIILLAIASFILGTICSVRATIIKVLSEMPRITPLVIAWLSLQVVVDMLITITLVIVLYRSRTGSRKTDTILNRFIRGAIQTGFLASTFAVADLTTFILLPRMNLYGMFAIPLGRIYTNTLLDTLLSRELLKTDTNGGENLSLVIDSVCWAPADSQAISTLYHSSRIDQEYSFDITQKI